MTLLEGLLKEKCVYNAVSIYFSSEGVPFDNPCEKFIGKNYLILVINEGFKSIKVLNLVFVSIYYPLNFKTFLNLISLTNNNDENVLLPKPLQFRRIIQGDVIGRSFKRKM